LFPGGCKQNVSFGQLCLIQGFLAYNDIEALCSVTCAFGSSDKLLKSCLLFELYPLVFQLCLAADFKYHSFKLLELWYKKLLSSLSHLFTEGFVFVMKPSEGRTCMQYDTVNQNDDGSKNDGSSMANTLSNVASAPNSDIQTTLESIFNDTINLIVGHANCNVDGVDESINAVLTTLLEVDARTRQTCTGMFFSVQI
jgi:hypothetical protein